MSDFRATASDVQRGVNVQANAGVASERPRNSGIELHCTVPYAGVGAEDIIHRLGDGTLITEARDVLNAERTFYHYVGGQGSQDGLANAGVIGTHPIVTPASDPDYVQLDDDLSLAVRFRTLMPSNPNVTQFALLNMTPTSVTHAAYTTLITHASTVGFFDEIVALNSTTVLLVNVNSVFNEINTCVVTRSGASLSAGAVQSHASGFSNLAASAYRVVRINDTTAYLVASDQGDIQPNNQRMVKGVTLTVSGSSTTLGVVHDMHPGDNSAPQITPVPAGFVVVGIETNENLFANFGPFDKYSVWAVNPLTGAVGDQVLLEYEFTGEAGFMQPTGNRQAAYVFHGIEAATQDAVVGTEEFIYGLIVDVATDLTVTPRVNRISAEGESDAQFINAGRGTDVGPINVWHDRSRGRGHLYGDAATWVANQGGISHYRVTNQTSYGPSQVTATKNRVAPRNGG